MKHLTASNVQVGSPTNLVETALNMIKIDAFNCFDHGQNGWLQLWSKWMFLTVVKIDVIYWIFEAARYCHMVRAHGHKLHKI